MLKGENSVLEFSEIELISQPCNFSRNFFGEKCVQTWVGEPTVYNLRWANGNGDRGFIQAE